MNVLICYKWERDSAESAISHDGSLKWFNTQLKASNDDAAAIACARQIVTDTEGELSAVTIGDGDTSWALSRGATRAVSVNEFAPSKDDAVTAAKLAKAIKATGNHDVILMGDAQEFAGVVPVTAALLGIPLVAGVSDVEIDSNNPDYLIAHRTTSEALEEVKIRVPALISVVADSSEKNSPSMRQILAAKKRSIEKISAEEIGMVEESCVTVKETHLPTKREVRILEGNVSQVISELISTLHADDVL